MTLSVFSFEKIGPDGCNGPGILGYGFIINLSDNRFTFNQRNNLFNSLLTVLSNLSKDDDS